MEAGEALRPDHAIHFGNPDFGALCRAFGWAHRPGETAADLEAGLRSALAGDEPTLITVPIDYGQNVRLASFGEPTLGA